MQDEKIEMSYSTLWKSIIRPPKDDYTDDNLGESVFIYKHKTYVRKDYDILNKNGHILKASLIEPDEDSRVINSLNP